MENTVRKTEGAQGAINKPAGKSRLRARAPESVKPGKIKAVIYGLPGVGKTMLALSFPKPYYFDVENGAKEQHYRDILKNSGGFYMGPEEGTLSFDTLIEQMQALATEEHPFKTLIVDSLTKLFQTAIAQEQERMDRAGKKDEFGASRKPAIAMMRRVVMWASRLDMNIWFICHETADWQNVDGQRSDVGRTADAWDKLIYELDLAVQVVKRGPQRLAIVRKSRLLAFPDGEQFPLEYAEFAKRSDRETIESGVATIMLASPEQVVEIEKLLSIVKIPDDTIQKWFDKAGVDKFADMTTDKAQGVIDFMRKKLSASAEQQTDSNH